MSILRFWFRTQGHFPLRKDQAPEETELPLPEVKKIRDLRDRGYFLAQTLVTLPEVSAWRMKQLLSGSVPANAPEIRNIHSLLVSGSVGVSVFLKNPGIVPATS